jgi:hypothetical protein
MPADCDCKNAILSVDQIRYRYSRPVAIHSINVANQSGNHMACWSLGDWRQGLGRHGTNNGSRSTSCATQKARTPRNHMWNPCAEMEWDGKAIASPLTGYMRDTDSKSVFHRLFLSYPWHDSLPTPHYVDRGFVCQHDTSFSRWHVIMYTTTHHPRPSQIRYPFPIESF